MKFVYTLCCLKRKYFFNGTNCYNDLANHSKQNGLVRKFCGNNNKKAAFASKTDNI